MISERKCRIWPFMKKPMNSSKDYTLMVFLRKLRANFPRKYFLGYLIILLNHQSKNYGRMGEERIICELLKT